MRKILGPVLAASLSLSCTSDTSNNLTLPEVPEGTKIRVFDHHAPRTIIHIRQTHQDLELNAFVKGDPQQYKPIPPEANDQVARVTTVQREITEIMASLSRQGIRSVFTEGLSAERTAMISNAIAAHKKFQGYIRKHEENLAVVKAEGKYSRLVEIAQRMRLQNAQVLIDELSPEERAERGPISSVALIQLADIHKKLLYFQSIYDLDSLVPLAATGTIDLYPAESERSLVAASEVAASATTAEDILQSPIIFDERENSTIQVVAAQQREAMSMLIFGSAHDFSNNIAYWNETHPDDQDFNLIEITPKSLTGK